jgi:hypothetical protein
MIRISVSGCSSPAVLLSVHNCFVSAAAANDVLPVTEGEPECHRLIGG